MRISKQIRLHDKEFEVSIWEEDIVEAVRRVAERINVDFEERSMPLFISVLNGAFMFSAELLKNITIPCNISFVKLASYRGERSTGDVMELIGLSESIAGRDIIILEDIVDTGNTYECLVETLRKHSPKSVRIATLLLKPDVYSKELPVDYVAIKVPNEFIVGYGLDYNGLGRNLPDLYTLIS